MRINAAQLRRDVIVIGASAGGFDAIRRVVSALPEDLAAVVGVVLHRAPDFNSVLGRIVGDWSRLRVIEPTGRVPLINGTLYVAPPDHHMRFLDVGVAIDCGPKEHFARPAVDPLFTSAVATFGPRVVGVVLSGNGSDGLLGCLAIKAAGGLVIVQDPAEAKAPSMPIQALKYDHVDARVPVDDIGWVLAQLAMGASVELPERDRAERSAD